MPFEFPVDPPSIKLRDSFLLYLQDALQIRLFHLFFTYTCFRQITRDPIFCRSFSISDSPDSVKKNLFFIGNPALCGRPMERVGYRTVAKLHAMWRARTMSILSRRGAPENACSPARRRRPPAPLRLLSLSPSSSFISVRKTLS